MSVITSLSILEETEIDREFGNECVTHSFRTLSHLDDSSGTQLAIKRQYSLTVLLDPVLDEVESLGVFAEVLDGSG